MFSDPIRLTLLWAVLLLGACAPRGEIGLAEVGPDVLAATRSVFVATNRQPREEYDFAETRDQTMHFARYDVSIPADRQPGEINWPKGRAPDPSRDFVTRGVAPLADAGAMRAALARELAARPGDQREVVIFVHGYNNSFAEGLYRTAQLGHDFASKGVIVHYSWPSAANPLNYAYDRDSVLFARQGLVDLIALVRASGARQVVLIAHSMGSLLAMEALVRADLAAPGSVARQVQSVVLMSPDIDPLVFLAQAATLRGLPEDFVILGSRKDKALRLSALVTGQRARLGNMSGIGALSSLDITILDTTEFSESQGGHFDAASSPALIALLSQISALDQGFQRENAQGVGLLPAVILQVQEATRVILLPGTEPPVQAP